MHEKPVAIGTPIASSAVHLFNFPFLHPLYSRALNVVKLMLSLSFKGNMFAVSLMFLCVRSSFLISLIVFFFMLLIMRDVL